MTRERCAGFGLVRSLAMRDQKDPSRVFMLVDLIVDGEVAP